MCDYVMTSFRVDDVTDYDFDDVFRVCDVINAPVRKITNKKVATVTG